MGDDPAQAAVDARAPYQSVGSDQPLSTSVQVAPPSTDNRVPAGVTTYHHRPEEQPTIRADK
jgi:hypothetical protein